MSRSGATLALLLLSAATSAVADSAGLQQETHLLQVARPAARKDEAVLAQSGDDPGNDALAELQSLREEFRSMQELLVQTVDEMQSQMQSCCTGCTPGRNNSDSSATTETTTTTTTTTTIYRPSLCAAFGDPHFITFDGAQTTFVGDMVMWLVKSKDVWMQALSEGSQGKFMGFAVGGPFMQGHTLVVFNGSDTGMTVLWDGEPILAETVCEFHSDGFLDAYRTEDWDASKFNDEILNLRNRAYFEIGPWPVRFTGKPRGGLYLFRLPTHIEVTLSGVDFMSAVIAMEAQAGGQGGYCGNFNGSPDDDAKPIIPSWDWPLGPDLDPVPEEQNIFKISGAVSLLGLADSFGRQPHRARSRALMKQALLKEARNFDMCSQTLLDQAKAKCAPVTNEAFHKACIFDICITGQLGAADDILAAEVLEEGINARGYPKFVGHGQCLDSEGRQFKLFKTHLRTDEACQDVLRQLATLNGVLGAQLHRGSTCEVLMEQGSNPTSIMIPEGWAQDESTGNMTAQGGVGSAAADLVVGHGLVSKATEDASWNCWQLV